MIKRMEIATLMPYFNCEGIVCVCLEIKQNLDKINFNY